MPLSNTDLSDIAREFSTTNDEMGNDKKSIPNVQAQITEKQAQANRAYIPFNDAQIERVIPYEVERRWLDGVTYNPITTQQINDAASRTSTNIFFPNTWTKSNTYLTPSGNGNSTTTSVGNENDAINGSIEQSGMIATITLLVSGQAGTFANTLNANYSPGQTTITVTSITTNTPGRLLYISGSGTSALVRITSASLNTVGITEIIAPASTITTGGSVIENIPGFSNAERQAISSGAYQRIITGLTNNVNLSATAWNTALTNQLNELNINIDSAAQIASAKTSVQNAQIAFATWDVLPSTGGTGKYSDYGNNILQTAYSPRVTFIPTRISQITVALGTVSQDADGNYSGNGLYLQRFKCLNFLINSANGPLYQVNALQTAKSNLEQKVVNNVDKLATYSNITRYGAAIKDPTGHNIEIDTASQFSIGDTIVLAGNNLPGLQTTITGITSKVITLAITIPTTYTKATKASIIKRI